MSPNEPSRFAAVEDAFRRRCHRGATKGDWNDWGWQLRNRLRTAAEFERAMELSDRERGALGEPGKWRMPLAATPYAALLLSLDEPDGPLRRTLLPDGREAKTGRGERRDPLGEEAHQVAPGLVRSYPHKALLLATRDCAAFCRYCTRARTAGKTSRHGAAALYDSDAAVEWLAKNGEVRDVLVSGGDPLTMSDGKLEGLLKGLRAIPHVELIRIGTKAPAVLPQRSTRELARILRRHRPVWMSLHFTHPLELTPRAAEACGRLLDAGIPLMNQTVLLKGVNDDLETMKRLNEGLLRIGVKPYYLHQGDMAAGTGHMRSTIAKGRSILREMCGKVSGYAIPQFMVDPPGGGGKRHLF